MSAAARRDRGRRGEKQRGGGFTVGRPAAGERQDARRETEKEAPIPLRASGTHWCEEERKKKRGGGEERGIKKEKEERDGGGRRESGR